MGETLHLDESLREGGRRKAPASSDLSRFRNVPALLQKSREAEAAERRAELTSLALDLDFHSISTERGMRLPTAGTSESHGDAPRQFEVHQKMAKQAQELLYSNLGIDPENARNAWDRRFLKGLVDGAILSGADFAESVLRNPRVVLEAIANLDLSAIVEGLSETVADLVSGDWYRFGKGLGVSGLAVTGTWAVLAGGKKLVSKALRSKVAEGKGPVSFGGLRAQRGAVGDLSAAPERKISFDLAKNETYRHYPALKPYAEILGDLKPSDVMGHGENAMVVRHPKRPDAVVKIPYPGDVDSVVAELASHQKAYDASRQRGFPASVAVPKLFDDFSKSAFPLYTMQRVDGQSLRTKMLLESVPEYRELAERLAKTRDVGRMTDDEVYRYLADNHMFWAEYLDMVIRSEASAEHARKFLASHPEVQSALGRLRAAEVGHADLHGGNLMLGRDGRIYLIDFGRVFGHSPQHPWANAKP